MASFFVINFRILQEIAIGVLRILNFLKHHSKAEAELDLLAKLTKVMPLEAVT